MFLFFFRLAWVDSPGTTFPHYFGTISRSMVLKVLSLPPRPGSWRVGSIWEPGYVFGDRPPPMLITPALWRHDGINKVLTIPPLLPA